MNGNNWHHTLAFTSCESVRYWNFGVGDEALKIFHKSAISQYGRMRKTKAKILDASHI